MAPASAPFKCCFQTMLVSTEPERAEGKLKKDDTPSLHGIWVFFHITKHRNIYRVEQITALSPRGKIPYSMLMFALIWNTPTGRHIKRSHKASQCCGSLLWLLIPESRSESMVAQHTYTLCLDVSSSEKFFLRRMSGHYSSYPKCSASVSQTFPVLVQILFVTCTTIYSRICEMLFQSDIYQNRIK